MLNTDRYVIVGVDAGLNVAWAVLDLSGNLLGLGSKKGLGRGIIGEVKKYGEPLIISTDVSKPPKLVKELATSFGARLSLPKEDMRVKEKETLTKGFVFGNRHERDALASALRAFKEIEGLVRRVKKRGGDEEVVRKILKGEAKNIREAMRVEERKEKRRKKRGRASVEELLKLVEKLKEENERLRRERKWVVYKVSEVRPKVLIEDKARIMNKLLKDGKVPILRVEGKKDLRDVYKDVVYLKTQDERVLKELERRKVRVLVMDEPKEIEGFVTVRRSDLNIKEEDGIEYVEFKEFERLVKEVAKKVVKEVLKDYKRIRGAFI
ncbi:MAG TPA: DUF460 domain-containing protein [Candidatus Aenigmarchaeota archaeon]|nr:DUF460 domain-containing protein [Candidatus Aenigmarchaeota archaeon]